MPETETQTLVETIELSRNLTKYYLSNLKGKDVHKVFEIEGQQVMARTLEVEILLVQLLNTQ